MFPIYKACPLMYIYVLVLQKVYDDQMTLQELG